ncbi:hypothetical protein MTO96_024861 [Rhipicephalus appendiculatus]
MNGRQGMTFAAFVATVLAAMILGPKRHHGSVSHADRWRLTKRHKSDHRDCYLLASAIVTRGEYIMRGQQGSSLFLLVATIMVALILAPDETTALIFPLDYDREEMEERAQ